VERGSPSAAVDRAARRWDADLVVLLDERRRRFSDVIYGSSLLRTVASLRRPLLALPAEPFRWPPQRVVVGVGGSDTWLAALRFAARLSLGWQLSGIDLVHAVHEPRASATDAHLLSHAAEAEVAALAAEIGTPIVNHSASGEAWQVLTDTFSASDGAALLALSDSTIPHWPAEPSKTVRQVLLRLCGPVLVVPA
jgi:nucleotide-binding universal stress UspA family protein